MEKSNHQATLVASCCYHLPIIGWSNYGTSQGEDKPHSAAYLCDMLEPFLLRSSNMAMELSAVAATLWPYGMFQPARSDSWQESKNSVGDVNIYIYILLIYVSKLRTYINHSTSHEISYMSISLNDYGTFTYFTYIYIYTYVLNRINICGIYECLIIPHPICHQGTWAVRPVLRRLHPFVGRTAQPRPSQGPTRRHGKFLAQGGGFNHGI